MQRIQSVLVGAMLAATMGAAAAQAPAPDVTGGGPLGGWGMMGGYGPGGYGPGMMGGYGPGGHGPEIMGGYGPGMMNGYGGGRWSGVDLTDEQRRKIRQIADGTRKQHWPLMGQMMDEQNKLRDLLEQVTPDPKAVGAAQASVSKLHQEMLESHIQSRNEIHAVLTPEQREQVEQRRRRGWGDDSRRGGYGRGMWPR